MKKDDEVDFSWAWKNGWFTRTFCFATWMYTICGAVIIIILSELFHSNVLTAILFIIQLACLILGIVNFIKFGNLFGPDPDERG